jgi:Flp pilus assembly protein TadB
MITQSLALLLLAAAIQLWSRARTASMRLAWLGDHPMPGTRLWRRLTSATSPKGRRLLLAGAAGVVLTLAIGWPGGPPVGAATAAAVWWLSGRAGRPARADPMTVAATWDLLAACLRSGLPVPTAVAVVAGELPAEPACALKSAADLLALGADPLTAWTEAAACPETAALARGAKRAARSGTGLADLVTDLAAEVRASASDTAEAAAQRAGVLITAPLALCFLPAFLCLGLAPVVAGLVSHISL